MKKNIVSALAVTVALAGTACSTSQQRPICNVGRLYPYAVEYAPAAGAPACASTVADGLNDPAGGLNVLGAEAYYDNSDPTLKLVAFRPAEYQGVAVPAEGSTDPNPNALGDWTSEDPDGQNICHVASTSAAVQGTSSYTFKDVRVLVDPAHPGTQMTATLTYDNGAGCSADYQIVGVWPPVDCEVDADCDPCAGNTDVTKNAAGTAAGNQGFTGLSRSFGSGIAADFKTTCRHGLCLLTKDDGSAVTGADFPAVGTAKVCPKP